MRTLLLIFLIVWVGSCSRGSRPVYTHVTFMYNIKRGDLNNQFKRSYEYYLSYFDQLLASDSNLIVFGGKDIEKRVWQRRKQPNTVFVHKQLQEFRKLWYDPLVQKLREGYMNDPSFPYKGHPQFSLPDYNPIIMSKLYVLTQAIKHDKWNTDIIVWTDGGFMHQFPRNIFSPQNVVEKFYQVLQPQWMFYTYTDPNMFLGYKQSEARYIGRRAEIYEPVLASCMGGYIQILRDIKCAYENLLRITLQNGDMNSDESVITLMPIRFPFLIPNTVGIYLNDMVSKLHMYEQVNRIPDHPRSLNAAFDEQGILMINQKSVKSSFNPKSKNAETSSNVETVTKPQAPKEKVDQKKDTNEDASQKYEYSPKLITFFKDQETYFKGNFYKSFTYLAIIVAIYLLMIKKNYDLKGQLSSKKPKSSKPRLASSIIISSQ